MGYLKNLSSGCAKTHSNRKQYNWLAYNTVDRFLKANVGFYRGVIYDLGCGDAPYKDFFMQYADSYVGVDWSTSIYAAGTNIVADLNKSLPIRSEVADTIVSISVIEHLYEPQTMLNEAFRILKPSGNIVLQVPWQWWLHEGPNDYFRYTPYALKHMLNKAGFVNVLVEPQSGFFSMWILKLNYFTRRLIRGPRLLGWAAHLLLIPFWWVGQMLAPVLDKLDREWSLETCGYFVIASKL